MRELSAEMIKDALFAMKFGCFPRGIMHAPGDDPVYDPPSPFVQLARDNFAVSFAHEHWSFRNALISDSKWLSSDEKEFRKICRDNLVLSQSWCEFWIDNDGLEIFTSGRFARERVSRPEVHSLTIHDVREGIDRKKKL
jgi:hypothetical protein